MSSEEAASEANPEVAPPPERPVRLEARPAPAQGIDPFHPVFPASVPKPPPGTFTGAQPTVDKYFGARLPPVCRKLGCYVTDNGKFFYCINPACHKDRKRDTKYNRRKKSLFYFSCPKCQSRDIQLHLRKGQYECLQCAFAWRK